MKIFQTKGFARFARKERLSRETLRETAKSADENPDADLGGGVIKQRVARQGGGKSGGYRTIILLRKGKRAVFVHGFAKKDTDNIGPDDLKDFRELAKHYLKLTAEQIATLIDLGELVEVPHEDADEKAR